MLLHSDKDIRQKCRELRGEDFSDRTWACWRRLMAIPRHTRWLTPEQSANLFTFALLKKERPCAKIRLFDVVRERRDRDWNTWLGVMCELPRGSLIQSCYGHQLSEVLYQLTGRQVAEATLYEWGREPGMLAFKRRHKYSATQVSRWIQRAKKQFDYKGVIYGYSENSAAA